MKRVALVALSLAAVAASGLAAASAYATEPVWEKVIIVPVKEGEKVPYTAVGSKATLATVEGSKIICATASASGSLEGTNGLSMAVTFRGCEGFASKCTTAGAAEGEVLTNGFSGKLGNLKSESTPGIALTGLKEVDAEFSCGGTSVKLLGGVVGPISPEKLVVNKLTLLFKAQAGVQLFESLFGGPLDTLSLSTNGGKAVRTGLTQKISLNLKEPVEIT